MNAEQIKAIEDRANAATPGSWKVIDKGNTVKSVAVTTLAVAWSQQEMICPNMSPKTANADFIANARTDIPALLIHIREQQAEIDRLKKLLDAAVEDLSGAQACFSCDHFYRNDGKCSGAGKCRINGIKIFPCDEPGVYRAEIPNDGRDTFKWRELEGGDER